MKAIIPWVRTIISFPLGLAAIMLFHSGVLLIFPSAYGELDNDLIRALSLTLIFAAGVFGSVIVGVVAGHRIWLHMAFFFAIALVIDIDAINGELSAQPLWFKALVIATLPVQMWLGARLVLLAYPKGNLPAAI
ncbi:MAG: hypothetical protein WCZ65_06245 [Lysobacteraceae bacterium]